MVFCRGCGKEIHETAVSCPHCGAVQRIRGSGSGQSGTLWLPVPSLVMGIITVLALFDESKWDIDTCVGLGFFVITSIVLGGFGMAIQEKGKGMSIAGLVLGIIGLLGLIGRFIT